MLNRDSLWPQVVPSTIHAAQREANEPRIAARAYYNYLIALQTLSASPASMIAQDNVESALEAYNESIIDAHTEAAIELMKSNVTSMVAQQGEMVQLALAANQRAITSEDKLQELNYVRVMSFVEIESCNDTSYMRQIFGSYKIERIRCRTACRDYAFYHGGGQLITLYYKDLRFYARLSNCSIK